MAARTEHQVVAGMARQQYDLELRVLTEDTLLIVPAHGLLGVGLTLSARGEHHVPLHPDGCARAFQRVHASNQSLLHGD